MTDIVNPERGLSENYAVLRLRNGPLAAPVLCRVVSMMLARADCPVNRIDDALLICDTITAHATSFASDAHLALRISVDENAMELRVSDLARGGAQGLMEASTLPAIGNVLERMADQIQIEPSKDGETDELLLRVNFA